MTSGHPQNAAPDQSHARSSGGWRDLRSRLFWTLILNGVLLAVLWRLGGRARAGEIADGAAVAAGLLAVIWCFPRGASPWRARQVPSLMALGLLAVTGGDVIWACDAHVLHRESLFPSWADALYLCSYPLHFAAILRLPARPLPWARRARVIADSLMTMTAMVTFSWYFLLGPTLLQNDQGLFFRVLSAFYPLGNLLLLFALLLLAAHCKDEDWLRRPVALLGLGLVCYLITDSLFCYGELHNTYQAGGLMDVGYPLANLLTALGTRAAAYTTPGAAVQDPAEKRAPKATPAVSGPETGNAWFAALLPYALLPLVGALVAWLLGTHAGGAADARLVRGVLVGASLLFAQVLARQVLVIWENRRLNALLGAAYEELVAQNRSLAQANARLEGLATTDGMTGLTNHRTFQERLRQELERAAPPAGRLVSVVLLDVDYFKQYNDRFGHPAGDQVLIGVAALLRAAAPPGAVAARYGGEEFALLLPGAGSDTACRLAEQVRTAVAAHPFAHRRVTVSIGVADTVWAGYAPQALVAGADRALYAAKHAGRNRVLTNVETEEPEAVFLARAA